MKNVPSNQKEENTKEKWTTKKPEIDDDWTKKEWKSVCTNFFVWRSLLVFFSSNNRLSTIKKTDHNKEPKKEEEEKFDILLS